MNPVQDCHLCDGKGYVVLRSGFVSACTCPIGQDWAARRDQEADV